MNRKDRRAKGHRGPQGGPLLNRGVVLESIETIRLGIAGLKRIGHKAVPALEYEFGDIRNDPGPGATPDEIRPQYVKLVTLADKVATALEER